MSDHSSSYGVKYGLSNGFNLWPSYLDIPSSFYDCL